MEVPPSALVPDVLTDTGSFVDRLPDAARQRLLDVAKTLRVSAGEAIFRAKGPHVGVILEGTARSYLAAPNGRQITVRYVHRGSMIGSWGVAGAGELVVANQAITHCAVLELDVPTVSGMIRSDPDVAAGFVAHLSERLQVTYEALAASAFGTIQQRIVRHLLELAEEDGEGRRVIAVITQQQLADGIATSREVVARAIGQLRAGGLIRTQAGEIELTNRAGLWAVVRGWPTPVRHGPAEQRT